MSRLFWISQTRILEYGCHFFLQIIFLIQGLKTHFLHCYMDSLLLSYQETLYTHAHTHTHIYIYMYRASNVALVVKNPPVNAGDTRPGFHLCIRKIPWRRAWQPTSVFFLENHTSRGAWRFMVHRITMSWTRLTRHSTACT